MKTDDTLMDRRLNESVIVEHETAAKVWWNTCQYEEDVDRRLAEAADIQGREKAGGNC